MLLLDRASFPRDKLCAGWITPRVFKSLGMQPESYPYGMVHLRKIHFYIYGRHLPIVTRQYSIRRFEFDNWLLELSETPVDTHKVQHIVFNNNRFVIDDQYSCDILVGAGGSGCPVYHAFFKPFQPRQDDKHIATLEIETRRAYFENETHLWFFQDELPGYAWFVPKEDGYINLGLGGKRRLLQKRELKLRDVWEKFIARLRSKGFIAADFDEQPGGYHYHLRQKGLALKYGQAFIIGDAAGLATTDMGEGIGPAIESGRLAAESIIHNKSIAVKKIRRYSWYPMVFPGL